MPGKGVVRKVAEVARLKLSEKELEGFSRDLSSILKAFDDIGRAATKNVKPTFQPVGIENVTRDDVVEPGLSQEEAMTNTKNKEEGHFKGPKVV